MAVSFGMLGILLMLDVCFVVNYFVVRALRRWTNCKLRHKQHRQEKDASSKKDQSPDMLSDVAFAWLLGSVKLEAMAVKKFPGWKPIPYQLGLISTSLFVILSCLVLAPDLVAKQLGISSSLTLDADLCVVEAFEAGLQGLREDLWNQTNLQLARQQHTIMTNFHQALVNDTALYGVPPYHCPSRGDVSGHKQNWDESGSFFPGYCEEALEEALQVAQDRDCYHEICACPTMPDSAVFQLVGLAGKKVCAAEVCIEVPHACPPHAKEEIGERDERLQADYRYQQLEAAEARRANLSKTQGRTVSVNVTIPDNVQSAATQTANKILHQVDIASYVYIAYSCIGLFFPSPLILFRMPYWITIKRFLFGVQKPYFICFVLCLFWGYEYFSALWYSPDLWLFLNNLRLDPCFVDADYLLERQQILDGICQELMPLEPDFSSSAMTVADVLREVSFFADSCDCSFPNYYTSKLATSMMNSSTNTTITALGFNASMEFCQDVAGSGDCTTMFVPGEGINYLGNSSICTNFTESRRLVWESTSDSNTQSDQWYDLYLASGFVAALLIKFAVANFGLSLMELADPFVVCAGEFLWMAPPTSFGTNDRRTRPRITASRESYQSGGNRNSNVQTSSRQIPQAFDEQGRALPNEMVQTWFKTKQRSLFHVGLSKTILWGSLFHLCIINLFLSVYQEVYFPDEGLVGEDVPSVYQMLEERDRVVLAACLGCAAFVALLGVYIVCRLNRLSSVQKEHLGDTDDSSESDGGNNYGGAGRSLGDDCATMTQMMCEGDIDERELFQGIVVQLDTEDRCSSPIIIG